MSTSSKKRKRSTQCNQSKKGNGQDDEDEDDKEILTPHVKRLLKLVEEGSREHAQLAASHLSIIARSGSPLLLWEILGRLQELLLHPNWTCREHAGLAMQGVAQHLPRADQDSFLQHISIHHSQISEEKEKERSYDNNNALWLTTADVLKHFDAIMTQGRRLVSKSEQDFDHQHHDDDDDDGMFSDLNYQEEKALQRIDQSVAGSHDFVEQRVALQRRILAQRLGLAGLIDVIGTANASHLLPSAITSHDLLSTNAKSKNMGDNHDHKDNKNAKKKKTKTATPSIRPLLVMEMNQQNSLNHLSHKNAQTLLATELLYRMFDARWEVRHGSLVGIMNLFKAWRRRSLSSTSFGAWPRDLLARCLCILGLDRFADFGAAAADTLHAPVRDMAGQVMTLIYMAAPPKIQEETRQVLGKLLVHGIQHDKENMTKSGNNTSDWEPRHGAMVALQFLVTIMDNKQQRPNCHGAIILNDLIQKAELGLADESDDVRSAAAKVLLHLLDINTTNKHLILQCIAPLWHAIENARNLAFSGANIIQLFSAMLCIDCAESLKKLSIDIESIFHKLMQVIDYESSEIKISTLNALANLVDVPVLNGRKQKLSMIMMELAIKIFDSFFEVHHWIEDDMVKEKLRSARCHLWAKLLQHLKHHFTSGTLASGNLLRPILLRYFGLYKSENQREERGQRNHCYNLKTKQEAARALSSVFHLVSEEKITINFLDSIMFVLLQSPREDQVTAACLLYRSIHYNNIDGRKCGSSIFEFPQCKLHLHQILSSTEMALACTSLEEQRDSACLLLYDKALWRLLDGSFGSSNDGLVAQDIIDTCTIITKTTQRVGCNPQQEQEKMITSMRVAAMMAGAIVADGPDSLPVKRTPLIRSLMTAIKSETNEERKRLVCADLVHLLELLFYNAESRAVCDKILTNICNLVIIDDESTKYKHAQQSATFVIQGFIRDVIQDNAILLESICPLWRMLEPFLVAPKMDSFQFRDTTKVKGSLTFTLAVANAGGSSKKCVVELIKKCLPALVIVACIKQDETKERALECTRCFSKIDAESSINASFPVLFDILHKSDAHSMRVGAVKVLSGIVDSVEMEIICPHVKYLLPTTMSLMTDTSEECAREATLLFSALVRVAPFVKESTKTSFPPTAAQHKYHEEDHSNAVIEHLIHGKPFPPCSLPDKVQHELEKAGIILRGYQAEGISWLAFLRSVKLNGALCDEMGLGKTLQALVAVAMAHSDQQDLVTLVVCPSTLVGHWASEIKKYFPSGGVLSSMSFVGNAAQRKERWRKHFPRSNIVVTSYSMLRTEVGTLSKVKWEYCILDEGHLLKNPNTATAIAARKIRAKHKLILSGTPVQNKINELWATFDFLMPNFLGSRASFTKVFGKPISKGQLPGASASAISEGMTKLKILHQQVLPFILRREKHHVLKDLPRKTVCNIPCCLSPQQLALYIPFSNGSEAKESLEALQEVIANSRGKGNHQEAKLPSLGSTVLRSLLYLRMICTHPALVERKSGLTRDARKPRRTPVSHSGKLSVLLDLLVMIGIRSSDPSAADNDTSSIYVPDLNAPEADSSPTSMLGLDDHDDDGIGTEISESLKLSSISGAGKKCLIFAQFNQSLDMVESIVLEPHFPSLRFLRIDGSVPPEKRAELADLFNRDESIKVMLLTTRVGSLGLNLTGASKVIFLEHDYNPHVDLQAMDRAHRIGQTNSVEVYRLVTSNSIEEKIMALQEMKLQMSKAIVNSDNSSMWSMGTDKLLDIFSFNDDTNKRSAAAKRRGVMDLSHMDVIYKDNQYESLSVESFVRGLVE